MTPFDPGLNQTISQANATSSAGGSLPADCSQVALTNTSATATAYFVCTQAQGSEAAVAAVVPASGGANGGFPILPGHQVRISVPFGPKLYRTIASAADGALLITPGRGN
jgi:hypothetical protein